MRSALLLIPALILTACHHPSRSYEVRYLEPTARQQLYTREEGDMAGLDALCGFNDSGLPGQEYPGLIETTSAVVGYESTDLPKSARPRCRVDVNVEHHAWLLFDLSEVTRDGRPRTLVQATLSGEELPGSDNANCRANYHFIAWVNFAPPSVAVPAMDEGTPHSGIGAPTATIDDEHLSFREYHERLSAAREFTRGRHGTAPNFVYTLSDREVGRLAETFATEEWNSPDPYHAVLVSMENPAPGRDSYCLAGLENLKLTLIFAEME
jgi:hypothetical protein